MMEHLNHVVSKQFGDDTILPADGLQKRMPGECVDAFGWRNLDTMLKHRFVSPISERADPVPDSEGRWWLDHTTLHRYKRTPMETDAATEGEGTLAAGVPAPPSKPPTPRTAAGSSSPEPSFKPEMFRPGHWRLSDDSTVAGKRADAWREQLKLEKAAGP